MSQTITFSVSKKGHEPVEVTRDFPENLDDSAWNDAVSDPDEDIHNLAMQSWIVKCQAGARARLEHGPEAVQSYVEQYTFGARSGGFSAPTLSADEAAEAGFSEEQLALLRKAGMRVDSGD